MEIAENPIIVALDVPTTMIVTVQEEMNLVAVTMMDLGDAVAAEEEALDLLVEDMVLEEDTIMITIMDQEEEEDMVLAMMGMEEEEIEALTEIVGLEIRTERLLLKDRDLIFKKELFL